MHRGERRAAAEGCACPAFHQANPARVDDAQHALQCHSTVSHAYGNSTLVTIVPRGWTGHVDNTTCGRCWLDIAFRYEERRLLIVSVHLRLEGGSRRTSGICVTVACERCCVDGRRLECERVTVRRSRRVGKRVAEVFGGGGHATATTGP